MTLGLPHRYREDRSHILFVVMADALNNVSNLLLDGFIVLHRMVGRIDENERIDFDLKPVLLLLKMFIDNLALLFSYLNFVNCFSFLTNIKRLL